MKVINHLKRATTEENITEVSPKIQKGQYSRYINIFNPPPITTSAALLSLTATVHYSFDYAQEVRFNLRTNNYIKMHISL